MKRALLTISTLMITSGLSGENIFRSLINSLSEPSHVTHAGLKRVDAGPFYYYKLSATTSDKTDPVNPINSVKHKLMTEDEKETARLALAKHYNQPVDETPMHVLKQNEKRVLYGDQSPIKDEAVVLAWERANAAEARLRRHREFMNKVKRSREDISTVKENDPRISQTDTNK